MSHASVIVAISPEQLAAYGSIEAAVEHQMEPYSEDQAGAWFGDGSRWDWWVIGGRFTGKFNPGYRPSDDPDNYQTCWLCDGTGKRNDRLGYEERLKNPAYSCNGCQGTGKMLKSASDFKEVANVVLRGELDESELRKGQIAAAEALWKRWQAEPDKSEINREWRYGLEPQDTLESLRESYSRHPLTAYAFLKDRTWYERDRLGWFGGTARTECEIMALEKGEDYQGRCLHTCEKTGAKIVSFAEENDDRWDNLFWARFIRRLPADTTLVCVDYHV